MNQTIARRLAHGLCIVCGRCPPQAPTQRCASCREQRRLDYRRRKRRGQCVDCSQPPAPGHVLCLTHLAKRHTYDSVLREQKVCKNCRTPVPTPGALCAHCREIRNGTRRTRQRQRKTAGFCVRCDRPRLLSHLLCEKHFKLQKSYYARAKRRAHARTKEPTP